MPTTPYDVQRKNSRFRDQRWLMDAVICQIGPEWDQDRLQYFAAPCTPDYLPAIMSLSKTIRKFDELHATDGADRQAV